MEEPTVDSEARTWLSSLSGQNGAPTLIIAERDGGTHSGLRGQNVAEEPVRAEWCFYSGYCSPRPERGGGKFQDRRVFLLLCYRRRRRQYLAGGPDRTEGRSYSCSTKD